MWLEHTYSRPKMFLGIWPLNEVSQVSMSHPWVISRRMTYWSAWCLNLILFLRYDLYIQKLKITAIAATAMLNFTWTSNSHEEWCRTMTYVHSLNLVQLQIGLLRYCVYGSGASDPPKRTCENSKSPTKTVGIPYLVTKLREDPICYTSKL